MKDSNIVYGSWSRVDMPQVFQLVPHSNLWTEGPVDVVSVSNFSTMASTKENQGPVK